MYDISKCLVDFSLCTQEGDLLEKFPELGAFDEFKHAPNDVVRKIAIATADPESPFIRIKERELMLRSIFEFIGQDLNDAQTKKLFTEVLAYESTAVLGCFGAYLMFCHDIDWTEYQTTKQTYDVLVIESNRTKDKNEDIDTYVKRRVNIQNHLKKIGADLKVLEAKIFPDSRAAREIAMLETKKKIRTYAEQYAEDHTWI